MRPSKDYDRAEPRAVCLPGPRVSANRRAPRSRPLTGRRLAEGSAKLQSSDCGHGKQATTRAARSERAAVPVSKRSPPPAGPGIRNATAIGVVGKGAPRRGGSQALTLIPAGGVTQSPRASVHRVDGCLQAIYVVRPVGEDLTRADLGGSRDLPALAQVRAPVTQEDPVAILLRALKRHSDRLRTACKCAGSARSRERPLHLTTVGHSHTPNGLRRPRSCARYSLMAPCRHKLSRHVRQFDHTGRPNVEPQALGVGLYERQQRILVHVSASRREGTLSRQRGRFWRSATSCRPCPSSPGRSACRAEVSSSPSSCW
jgi:hypothetical protein